MKLLRLKKWDDFGLEIQLELLSWKRFNVFTCTYSHSDLFKETSFWPRVSLNIALFCWRSVLGIDVICNSHSLEVILLQKTCDDYTLDIPPLLEF